MSVSEALSWSTRVSSSAINKAKWVRLPQATINKYLTRRSCTFVLVAESLVLPHELVALRLHILDVIVILGEGGVQLRLHRGACFWDFTSCFSKASARSTVSSYP
jgi:hypothetical protein